MCSSKMRGAGRLELPDHALPSAPVRELAVILHDFHLQVYVQVLAILANTGRDGTGRVGTGRDGTGRDGAPLPNGFLFLPFCHSAIIFAITTVAFLYMLYVYYFCIKSVIVSSPSSEDYYLELSAELWPVERASMTPLFLFNNLKHGNRPLGQTLKFNFSCFYVRVSFCNN